MEYKKRLDKYHKVEIIEVMDSNINQEKELILKHQVRHLIKYQSFLSFFLTSM